MKYKSLDLKLGYNCNNNCLHCVISEQKKESQKIRGNFNRDTNECINEISKSKNEGCNRIILTGGEPTIRNDFYDILKFSKIDSNLIVEIQSNGRRFKDLIFAKKCAPFIDFIIIALHSSNQEIHDKITQRKNSFIETIEGIKNLVELNVNVGIKVVISNYNYKDLKKILELSKYLNVNYINIAFPHANGNALKYFDKIVPNYKEIKEYVEIAIKYVKSNNLELELEQILPCLFDRDYPIKYFTDIKIKTNESQLKQLDCEILDWQKVLKKDRRKFIGCNICIYNNFCLGYWKEYIEKRGYSEFKPIKKIPLEIREIFLKQINKWR